MATIEDLAKRLSFGDATVHTPDGGLARARDVLAAVTAGTPPLSAAADQDAAQEDPEERDAAALRRALRERYDRPRARVSEMVARCAAAHAAGELVADSFAAHELESSRAALKRDFIELSTQQEVLSLLLGAKGGMPSVVADVQLGSVEDLEAALAEHKAAKKEAKSAARAALERAQGLVDEVASAHEEYEEERSALMQAIDALEAAQREREAAEAAMPSPQPAEVVASVERIAADASEAEAEARALAAAISADEEEIASLEADLLPLEEELGDLRATIDAEEAAAATEEQLGAKKARSREMHAWYSQMAQLVANLVRVCACRSLLSPRARTRGLRWLPIQCRVSLTRGNPAVCAGRCDSRERRRRRGNVRRAAPSDRNIRERRAGAPQSRAHARIRAWHH